MIILTQYKDYAINADHVVAYGITEENGVSVVLDNGASCCIGEFKDEANARRVIRGIVAAFDFGNRVYIVPEKTEVRDGTV